MRVSAGLATILGGYLDGGNTNLRVLTVPVSAGFKQVEAELGEAVAELPGSIWADRKRLRSPEWRPAARLVGRSGVGSPLPRRRAHARWHSPLRH